MWDATQDTAAAWNAENFSCCVAYIGGGNALLLFDSTKEDRRVEVVKNFTRKLLVNRPGLKVGAALGELEIVDGKLKPENINELYRTLKDNQNNISPAAKKFFRQSDRAL